MTGNKILYMNAEPCHKPQKIIDWYHRVDPFLTQAIRDAVDELKGQDIIVLIESQDNILRHSKGYLIALWEEDLRRMDEEDRKFELQKSLTNAEKDRLLNGNWN